LHILVNRKEFKNETQAYFQRSRDRTYQVREQNSGGQGAEPPVLGNSLDLLPIHF